MAVYVTKSMLSRFKNKIEYPYKLEDEPSTSGNQWNSISMESNSSEALSKSFICRVCARNGSIPLTEMFNSSDIMNAICRITNVVITPEDSLPKYICNECLAALKTAISFKSTCEASDRKFKRILNPMGDPAFHSYPYSKHDFQLILHQMKLKQMKVEQEKEQIRQKKMERLRQREGPKMKEFKCSPCDMTFPNKEKLAAHRRERQCMRRACDICGQLVLSIGQHMRHIHKQSSPHKCPTCGKEFPIIARLKNHMLVHTNTFNFFCDLCPYKCKHKYYLVMHMRTHTGEKPYKCPQCPATFVNPSNLNKHKLTHQEKQFKCAMCEKAFRTNTALREHHDATHMNIKHSCNYCGRDFCYKSDLRKHEIRNHNRIKRDYIGGEPSYKQVERMEKMQETLPLCDKWRTEEVILQPQPQHVPPPQIQTYIDHTKDYAPNHTMYYSEVTQLMHQPQMVQQQTVQLTLPELEMKKDEVKIYETQQTIGYF